MNATSRLMALVLLAGAALGGCTNEHPTTPEQTGALAKTTKRSIQEFVAAQGTYCLDDGNGGCVLFVPPYRNFLGWNDPTNGHAASFDYAGIANAWIEEESNGSTSFGTTFEGSVTEKELSDGRALVSVNLKTKNGLMWVASDFDFAGGDLLFGWRPADVLNDGRTPVLGDGELKVDFTIPEPGAPLPDLMKILIDPDEGMSVTDLRFTANVAGTFRAASGYSEGTAGKVQITQVGLLGSPSKSKNWDGFPAEHVRLIPTGN